MSKLQEIDATQRFGELRLVSTAHRLIDVVSVINIPRKKCHAPISSGHLNAVGNIIRIGN